MVLFEAVLGGGEIWRHIASTTLTGYALNTVALLTIAAVLMLITAVPAAWLVTMRAFPGRGVFEWLLILPLAAPGYVLAVAYADLLGVGGPVQSALREATGWAARDYWFPPIKSVPGCAFVLASALYPYVYLTARAAFVSQSVCTLEAARSLGASPRRTFWRVALPAARPAIAAGLALALMEAAADFGAADFLGAPTLTVGVFRAWSSYGDVGAAARIAILVVALMLTLQWIERRQRGQAGSAATSVRWRPLARERMTGLAALGASAFCAGVFLIGFALPVGRLIWVALETAPTSPPLGEHVRNSLVLAAAGASVAFVLALSAALLGRGDRPSGRLANTIVAAGYATPGAVLALGALALAVLLPGGLAGGAAIALLVWTYAVRFTAAGAAPIEAALRRAPASLGHAAQSLGAGPIRRTLQVDLPLALPGAAAAALILFVETLKELPATFMLAPYGWDTLAVRAYTLASDERLAAAAAPSLLITLAGLGPVILLSWGLARARPGAPGA
ncbi:MAG: iron ABC transporter permease [Pseudomonadota bacterium]